ncbi:MAG: ribbon-helix-helix domain-containing protein [Nanoarchaeota archaeon]|nr:ribbon-helix-helix domain-containing protein [Nanoarchaeota archaeon]
MKTKMSISIDRELIAKIEKIIGEGLFRNKSHIIEYSIKRFVDKEEGK